MINFQKDKKVKHKINGVVATILEVNGNNVKVCLESGMRLTYSKKDLEAQFTEAVKNESNLN